LDANQREKVGEEQEYDEEIEGINTIILDSFDISTADSKLYLNMILKFSVFDRLLLCLTIKKFR